jgi:hypothetical protein
MKKQGRNQSSLCDDIESGSGRDVSNNLYSGNQSPVSLVTWPNGYATRTRMTNLQSEPVINLGPEPGIRVAAGKSLEHVAAGL